MARAGAWALAPAAVGIVAVAAAAAAGASEEGVTYDEDFNALFSGKWHEVPAINALYGSIRAETLLLAEGVGWLLALARPLLALGAVGSLVAMLGAKLVGGQQARIGGRMAAILVATAMLGTAGIIAGYMLGPTGSVDVLEAAPGDLWAPGR